MEERPARQAEQHNRRSDQTDDRIHLAGCLEGGGVLGRRSGVDPLQGDGQRIIKIRRAQIGQHVVVEDGLALLIREEGRLEPRAGVQLDLPVFEVRLEIEEDRQPVIEASRPTPHWSIRAAALTLVSSVVRSYERLSCVYTTIPAAVRASMASMVVSACAIAPADSTPAKS